MGSERALLQFSVSVRYESEIEVTWCTWPERGNEAVDRDDGGGDVVLQFERQRKASGKPILPGERLIIEHVSARVTGSEPPKKSSPRVGKLVPLEAPPPLTLEPCAQPPARPPAPPASLAAPVAASAAGSSQNLVVASNLDLTAADSSSQIMLLARLSLSLAASMSPAKVALLIPLRAGHHRQPSAEAAYQLSRCVAWRSRVGRLPGSKQHRGISTVLLCATLEDKAWACAWPPLSCAAEDGDVEITCEFAGSSSTIVVEPAPGLCEQTVSIESTRVIIGLGEAPAAHPSNLCFENNSGFSVFLASRGPLSPELVSVFTFVTETAVSEHGVLGDLVPRVPNKHFQKLTFGGEVEDEATAPSSSQVRVWSAPAASGTVSFALSVLRLAFGALAATMPMMQVKLALPGLTLCTNIACYTPPPSSTDQCRVVQDKVTYLRNTSADLKAEVLEVIESALLHHVPPQDEHGPALFTDVSRLFFRLDSPEAAKRVGALAVRVCGKSCGGALALNARCLEATGDAAGATTFFQAALALNGPQVGEATMALARLGRAMAAGETERRQISSPDEDADTGDLKEGSSWERLLLRAKEKKLEREGFQVLQRGARLSGSVIYDLMRSFYEAKGMDAWGEGTERRQDTVPFYITSNPHIACSYSRVAASLIRDWAACGSLNPAFPVYILELGTGPGKFSSLFLVFFAAALAELRRDIGDLLQVVYVMTDFTQSNIDAWEGDSTLAPHLASGLLDFALLDCDRPSGQISLCRRRETFSAEAPSPNPILGLANYLFDSVAMDAFRTKNGALHEALVSTFAKKPEDGTPLDPSVAGAVRQEWNYRPIANPGSYYAAGRAEDEPKGGKDSTVDDVLGQLLASYGDLPEGSGFTLPVGGLRSLASIQALSSSRTCAMLVADKAWTRETQLHRKGDPTISLHGQ